MNKKGFVLMETLVVTIFTLFTFTILYNTIVPLLGKYNELSYYNDLDTTYDLFHIRKFLYDDPNYKNVINDNYKVITCNNGTVLNQEACYNLFDFLGVDTTSDEVIFLKASYKDTLKNNTSISVDVRNYLDYIEISDNVLILQNDGYISYLNI